MSALKPIFAVLLIFTCAEGFSQSQTAQSSFEAVSIKQSAPMPAVFKPGTRLVCPLSGCGGPGTSDPGLMRFTSTSLRRLIEAAYNVLPYRIEAASALDSPLFDITATLPRDATREQALLMLQNLLADRFQLKLHHSTKELPVYMLVVDKSGPEFKKSVSSGSSPAAGGRGSARGTIFTADASGARLIKFEFDEFTIAKFADSLTSYADRPVIDMTGLAGKYDIRMEFAPDILDPHIAPDLVTALREQLGLKLESKKAPIDVLIVDSAAKLPTEN